jgi:iron-sulfur cluster repair protein YtfE (RIC family)
MEKEIESAILNTMKGEKPGTSHPFTDFLRHTHLENNILFPRAIEMGRGR